MDFVKLAKFICLSSILLILFFFIFNPTWDSNDDLMMSMLAHGYGIAAKGTPNIVYSNIIWGYFIRLLPSINTIFGYTIATIFTLYIFILLIFIILSKLHIKIYESLIIILLGLSYPIIFPQYTINAGIFAVIALFFLYFYLIEERLCYLFLFVLLAYFSFLIRYYECFFILILCLPVLTLKKILNDLYLLISIIFLIILFILSSYFNNLAYNKPEWEQFNSWNLVRIKITDYNKDILLKKNTKLLKEYGYSLNDISLIKNWFFVDSKITNTYKINKMISEISTINNLKISFFTGKESLRIIFNRHVKYQFLAAFLIFLLHFNFKILKIWLFFILICFFIGFLGRPYVLRIYIPVVFLLLILPYLFKIKVNIVILFLIKSIILVLLINHLGIVLSASLNNRIIINKVNSDLRIFPKTTVVTWGAAFPFEMIYPLIKPSKEALKYRLYGLGVFTFNPNTVSYEEQKAGTGLVNRLLTEKGVLMVANSSHYAILKTYCLERFNGILEELDSKKIGFETLSRQRCVKDGQSNRSETSAN
ncbi:MAG: hypothetical protein LBV23_10580 [Deltaproteobacteria bacterium]|jgi:hypothetical protein|nr:hypothetical protein [Deltaproteobacteria bacterium]